MKLSFSLPSKQNPNPNPTLPTQFSTAASSKSAAPAVEFVTEFDASKTIATDPSSKSTVIPPLPNSYNPHKKMKNLHVPLENPNPNPQFENPSAAASPPCPTADISYGLNLRAPGNSEENSINLESKDRRNSIDTIMLQKLKTDLKDLPEDPVLEDYEDMPVEGFGAALLAGYGWYEGRGIGKNAKEDVKVVAYERWSAKQGIGFVADLPSMIKENGDGKKKKEGKRSRGREKRGEELERFYKGKEVRIVNGRDIGLNGTISKVLDRGDFVVVKLSRSRKEVNVRISDVADLGSVEEERCLRELKELKIRCGEKKRESKRDREYSRSRSQQREDTRASPQVCWLTSHIRVRIISKSLKGGRFYLKKGEVVDVVGPNVCDIRIDETRELVQGVDQDILETALPRRGGPVLVLYGKHKGVYGSLVEKDTEKEVGVVRDADTHTLLNLPLEQIAEYTADPGLIGY